MPEGSPRVERERRAFEIYYGLPKRSYKSVAAEFGVSLATIKSWARTHRWKIRLAERDAEVVRQASERTLSDAVAETERNLKMLRMAKVRLIKDIAEGKAKGAIGDLVKLIQLERELLSRPDPTAPADGGPSQLNPVIYIPDNGRGRPVGPVVILPDNGSDPDFTPFASGAGIESIPPEEVALAHA